MLGITMISTGISLTYIEEIYLHAVVQMPMILDRSYWPKL
jgi:hypothetical protein